MDYEERDILERDKMIDFISKNRDVVDRWDVEKTYNKAVINKFREDTGYYASYENYHVSVQSLGFSTKMYKLDYSEIMEEFEKFTGESALTGEQLKIKAQFDSLFKYSFFNIKEDMTTDKVFVAHVSSGHANQDVIGLLLYVINGTTEGSYELCEKYHVGYSDGVYDWVTIPELNNITITHQKNNNVRIKGLSLEQVAKIREIAGYYKVK